MSSSSPTPSVTPTKPNFFQETDTSPLPTLMGMPQTASLLVNLWVHESTTANPKPEAIFNYSLFPNCAAKPGDLVEVSAVKETSESSNSTTNGQNYKERSSSDADGESGISAQRTSRDDDPNDDPKYGKFLFVIREWNHDERMKQPNLQVIVVCTNFGNKLTPTISFPSPRTLLLCSSFSQDQKFE
jgi:hypothetical protein